MSMTFDGDRTRLISSQKSDELRQISCSAPAGVSNVARIVHTFHPFSPGVYIIYRHQVKGEPWAKVIPASSGFYTYMAAGRILCVVPCLFLQDTACSTL